MTRLEVNGGSKIPSTTRRETRPAILHVSPQNRQKILVIRFFERSADKSTDNSSDVVLPSNPSYLSRNIFSDEERKFLLQVCGVMVRGRVISKPHITKLLEKENEGQDLLHKFTIEQLVNRLKYEIRLNNRQLQS